MEKFYKKLKDINFASVQQQQKELWSVEGILHNQKFKFDTRPLKNNVKIGNFKSKADKIVFNIKDKYIILDVEELHEYIKENNLKDINIEDLLFKLDWNIIISK